MAGTAGPERKYCCGARRGSHEHPALEKHLKAIVSTFHVEEQNHAICRHAKRFARVKATHFRKTKIESDVRMVALHTKWYYFARIDSAMRMLPTMAPHLTNRLWNIDYIAKLIEDWEKGRR